MERRSQVGLQQPGLELTVQHDIKPQYFEAHVVLLVLWLQSLVQVGEVGLEAKKRLYDYLLNLLFDSLGIFIELHVNLLPEPTQVPLMASVHTVHTGILLVVLCLFIDGLVREMHLLVSQVLNVGSTVLVGCEAAEAILVQPDAQRIHSGDQHLYAHVELESLHQ